MKKIICFVLLIAVSTVGFSQTYKGQWMVGGNANFTSEKIGSNDNTTSYFALMPNVGYFFATNFAGGLRVHLDSEKFEDQDANTTFSTSPFIRYYFLPPTSKTNIFADASYGFGTTGMGNKEGFNQFAVSAGPAIFLTRNTALEFALQYMSVGGDAIGNDRNSRFGVNVGFQIHLGRGGGASQ
jgi:hypothetical protein